MGLFCPNHLYKQAGRRLHFYLEWLNGGFYDNWGELRAPKVVSLLSYWKMSFVYVTVDFGILLGSELN